MSAVESPLIYPAMNRVMQDISAVGKSQENQQQHYKFRGIDDMVNAAHPVLAKHGVFCAPEVLQRIEQRFERTSEGSQGQRVVVWTHVALEVRFVFYALDGSSVQAITWGEGLDNSDKATNKAMSGAWKYALITILAVPTVDVDDADKTSPPVPSGPPQSFTIARRIEPVPVLPSPDIKPRTPPKPRTEIRLTPEIQPALAIQPAPDVAQPGLDGFIPVKQQRDLHIDFRKVLTAASAKAGMSADEHFYAWLLRSGFVNEKREPTSARIPLADYAAVREGLLRFARTFATAAATTGGSYELPTL